MSEKEPLISVIIPIYNVEPYLRRCVDSVLAQTYHNLEVILVDDGSPDHCGEMCDEYAKIDTRVKVIHKPNGGQAEARNFGIDIANGEYIGFVDGDDFISPEMYEYLLQMITDNGADVSECTMRKFSGDLTDDIFACETSDAIFEGMEIISALLNEKYFTCTVPNMLVKASIAKSVKFDVGKIHEDILWPYRVLSKCKKAVRTTKILYAYLQRNGSTMNSRYSEKRFDALDALQQRALEIKNDYPDLYPVAERSYTGACMYHYQSLCRMDKSPEYQVYKKKLHDRFVNSDLKAVFSVTGIKYRMWYTLFKSMPEITAVVRNKFGIGVG